MAQSKDFTLKKYWTQVSDELNLPVNNKLRPARFDLSGRSIVFIAGQFYDLMSQHYLREETPTWGGDARFGGGGAFTAATGILVCTMDTAFQAVDQGNLIALREGTDHYHGYIDAVNDDDEVKLVGDNLPSGDLAAIDSVEMWPSKPSGKDVDLSLLRMMKTGQAIRIVVKSSATRNVEAVSLDAYLRFDPASKFNPTKLVYTVVGETLKWEIGSGLNGNPGTLTFWYPGVPFLPSLDADKIDLPDGPAMELSILHTAKLGREQMGLRPKKDEMKEIEAAIAKLMKTFGAEADAEVLKQKVLAFK